MALLRDHEQAVRETLGPEHMHVETIFSETVDGVEYLYWCSTQGEGGSGVESSGHWLDRANLDFRRRCIDASFPPEDLAVRQHAVTAAVENATAPDRLPAGRRPGPPAGGRLVRDLRGAALRRPGPPAGGRLTAEGEEPGPRDASPGERAPQRDDAWAPRHAIM